MKTTVNYVERWKDRHGKVRLYYRKRPNPRIPLRGPEGSPEFWEDYLAASTGAVVVKQGPKRAQPDTLRWLVEQYYKSAAFMEISEGYRRTRRGILDNFCEKHGDKRYAVLQPQHIRKLRDKMIDRPGAANNLLKALRQVFKYAVNYGLLDINPVAVVEKLKPKKKGGFHAWTIEEVEQFEARHPIGTKARLALALLLYTGQRRSDVIKMGRQHVKDGWMHVIQQKTDADLQLPILDELRRIIDTSPTGDLTYLVTKHGQPFKSSNSFGNWFRLRCNEAGLFHCTAHGLRKASASRLAELGCSVPEIMSITGHKTMSEVQRYTSAARQKQLAESVREKVDGTK